VAARAGGEARSLRRAVAELTLVSGLEVLAGEPVIALMCFGLAGMRAVMLPGARVRFTQRHRLLKGAYIAKSHSPTTRFVPSDVQFEKETVSSQKHM